MAFWQSYRPASRDSRNWSQSRVAQALKPVNRIVTIPSVIIPAIPAFDVPTIIAEFQVIASAPFSILNWNTITPSEGYVLCVRYLYFQTVLRYRFWKFSTNDVLRSPVVDLYTGQMQGLSPIVTFEFWTAGGVDLVVPMTVLTTSLIDEETQSTPSSAYIYRPTQNTALWYTNPLSDPTGVGSERS